MNWSAPTSRIRCRPEPACSRRRQTAWRRATIGWKRCFTASTKRSNATRSRCGARRRMRRRIARPSTSTAWMHRSAGRCCRRFAAPAWPCASGTSPPISGCRVSCVLRRPTMASSLNSAPVVMPMPTSRCRARWPRRPRRGSHASPARATISPRQAIGPPRVPVAMRRHGDGCARRHHGHSAPHLTAPARRCVMTSMKR